MKRTSELPRRQYVLSENIEAYLMHLARRGRSKDTTDQYRREVWNAMTALENAGLNCTPKSIGEPEIGYLRQVYHKDHAWKTIDWAECALEGFLKWNGNHIIATMPLARPKSRVPAGTIVQPEQVMRLFENTTGAARMALHLMAFMGYRRIEVIRALVDDFDGEKALVHGKGKMGGKEREVPYWKMMNCTTTMELSKWMRQRGEIVKKIMAINPNAEIPQNLLIWTDGTRYGHYGKSGMDKLVRTAIIRSGFAGMGGSPVFTAHDLRRFFGRTLYFAQGKTNLETVSDLMGHSDSKTTRIYLMLNIDDKQEAMAMAAKYITDRLGMFPYKEHQPLKFTSVEQESLPKSH